MTGGLSLFIPPISEWFRSRHVSPTEPQSLAWPKIASGENVLVTAPTGSGKTLTAFLWAINQLLSGTWQPGQCSAIYISPLKALNNDISQNLQVPLAEIQAIAKKQGIKLLKPTIHVRSGDTSPSERQRIWKRHPEILITTPESLFLLLMNPRAKELFSAVKTVILDEIHALVGSKRGVQLAASLQWLTLYAGDYQRIALSATVNPPELTAEYAAGIDPTTRKPRHIATVRCSTPKAYDIGIHLLYSDDSTPHPEQDAWVKTADFIKPKLQENNSTLVFVNARNTCEKIALRINEDQPELLAFSHHGSLAKDIRLAVEKRMKNGELKAIIATSSLELGIDVGAIDEVILVNSPNSVASAAQRIGRAGHKIGAVSKATLIATTPHQLIHSIPTIHAIKRQILEPITPPVNCLDVLAQIILALAVNATWDVDKLFNFITSIWSYKDLDETQFRNTIDLLSGKHQNLNLYSLKARLDYNPQENTVTTRKSDVFTIRRSSGTIPDRGLYKLRLSSDSSLVGELDEEFVWEAKVGDHFTLGTQAWTIDQITRDDVFVSPSESLASVPFWKAEKCDKHYVLAKLSGELLHKWNAALETKHQHELIKTLMQEQRLAIQDAYELDLYLRKQKQATGIIPNRYNIVLETINSPETSDCEMHLTAVVHAFLGGRVNKPLAIALRQIARTQFELEPDMIVNDDGIWFTTEKPLPIGEIFAKLTPGNIKSLVVEGLQDTPLFAAHFREAAGRALLIPKPLPGKRAPLWVTRKKAQILWEATGQLKEFPIRLEAWRTCLNDDFDLPNLIEVIREINDGIIQINQVTTKFPSPFANQARWSLTNDKMYQQDSVRAHNEPDKNWLEQLIATQQEQPFIEHDICKDFQQKRQRTEPAYLPDTPDDFINLVHDRWYITQKTWDEFTEALRQEFPEQAEDIIENANEKLVELNPKQNLVIKATKQNADDILNFQLDNQALVENRILQQLELLPPIDEDEFISAFPFPDDCLKNTLDKLVEKKLLARGFFVINVMTPQICLVDNIGVLSRMQRNKRRLNQFKPIDPLSFQAWVAKAQGIGNQDTSQNALKAILLATTGMRIKLNTLETKFFPARFPLYNKSTLDSLNAINVIAIGHKDKTISFAQHDDLKLLEKPPKASSQHEWPDTPFTSLELKSKLQSKNIPTTGFDLLHKLNDAFAQSLLTPNSFAPIRMALENNPAHHHSPSDSPLNFFKPTHRKFQHAKHATPYDSSQNATWRKIPWPPQDNDPVNRLEYAKERVRILVDRYGIIFPKLLERESQEFTWRQILPAVRIMELAGELVAGHFVNSIKSLQFAPLDTLDAILHQPHSNQIIWFAANDPASLGGIFDELKPPNFPTRREGNIVVMKGNEIVLTATASGQHITTNSNQPIDPKWLEPWFQALNRDAAPRQSVQIKTVNKKNARTQIPEDILKTRFHPVAGATQWFLYKKYFT